MFYFFFFFAAGLIRTAGGLRCDRNAKIDTQMDSSVFAPIKLYPVLIIYYALKFHEDFTHMSQPFIA